MKRSPALLVVPPLAGVLVLLSLVLFPTVIGGFLRSLALSVWLLLRLFVLSVDQRVYWGGIIVIVAFAICLRIVRRDAHEVPFEPTTENNAMSRLEVWRGLFAQTPKYRGDTTEIQQELLRLLVRIHALHRHVYPDFHVTDAFRRREIRLPEHVYALLFPEASGGQSNHRSILQRKTSKRQVESYRRAVEACLAFIEIYTAGAER